jgi:hypothetical protein
MKTMENLAEAETYYDKFSRVYNVFSPEWGSVIDKLLSVLRPGGRIVIMDGYIDKGWEIMAFSWLMNSRNSRMGEQLFWASKTTCSFEVSKAD